MMPKSLLAKIKRFLAGLRESKQAATSISARKRDQLMSKQQAQNASEGSTAYQAGGDLIVHTGMSYAEVRQTAMDVFQSNFYELAGAAREIARERAEAITEEFLEKLQAANPEGLRQANDPGFQHALFTMQKEHAKIGDKELGDLLVDLLVDRTKQDQRNILQIVLDESLNTAPKLTDSQLSNLSVIFLLRYTKHTRLGSHDTLGRFWDKHLQHFVSGISGNNSSFQHLQFTGCGSVSAGEQRLEVILQKAYPGLFLKGFERQEIEDRRISIGADPRLFVPCLNDPTKLQVNALDDDGLDSAIAKFGVSGEDVQKLKELFVANKMTHDEVRAKCIEIRDYVAPLFETWSQSSMKNFTLTSVGIAIGHANIKRLVKEEFSNLSIWIN